MQNRFHDPLGALADYEWLLNHSEEQEGGFTRNVERTATTSGLSFVRQQGAASPETLRYSGTILTGSQLDAMKAYFMACDSRTILFRDFLDNENEVLITSFQYLRKKTIRNPREATLHYWTYTIEMEVV